jgi:hypothetical protein
MKNLSLLTLVAMLSFTSCSMFQKSCCKPKNQATCTKEKCDKPCCDKEKKCTDGSCEKKSEESCKDDSCKKK